MLRKLTIIIIIAASFAWAAYDVSVEDAVSVPSPAVLDAENDIVATLVNHYEETINSVPIHGRIDAFTGETVLLSEDFEGETFPPTDWTQVITNTDTLVDPCTWTRSDLGGMHQHDSWCAVVRPSESVSDEWLITPAIDLSEVVATDGVLLRFHSAFYYALGAEQVHSYICISTDSGTTWTDTIADILYDLEDQDEGWIYIDDSPNPYEFDLSDYIGDVITIGFNYVSDGSGHREMQTLDDVDVVVENYNEQWASDGFVASVSPAYIHLPNEYTFTDPWIPTEMGVYRLRVWTELVNDEDPSNDLFLGTATAGGEVNLKLLRIVHPENSETPNEFFVPQCAVANLSDAECLATMGCRISSEGVVVYYDTVTATIPPDTSLFNGFAQFEVGDLGTTYMAEFWIDHPLDPDSSDNYKRKNFRAGYPHCIVPVEAICPIEGDKLSTFSPEAIYMNMGDYAEFDWWAIVRIESQTYHTVWYDSVHVLKQLAPNEEVTVIFSQFTASPDVDYICTFSSYINVEDFGASDLDVGFSGKTTGAEELTMPVEYALGVSNSIFSRDFSIQYAMPKSGHLSLRLYDVSGKLVETLVEEAVPAGYGCFVWDAKQAPAGLYFLRMEADKFSATRKLVLIH